MSRDGRLLRACVLAVVGLGLIAPIALGLWQTGRAAFGILPALGRTEWTLQPWHDLAALPGFATSLRLTLVTGIGSTLLSLLLATGFCATVHAQMTPAASARMLTPFLAIPHAAMAVGLAFVLAPSGWIARVVAPLAGWDRPPDWATVNDGWGLALLAGLMVKEVPFLLLVMLSALSQIAVAQQMAAGRALGYGRGIVWIKIIMPQVWPLIRLPVWVVLAYALSVVDMAMILGPSNPPTLAVAVTRWFTDADPAMLLPASAGAILQAVVVALAVALLWSGEGLARRLGRWWLRRGGRGLSAEPGLWAASAGVAVLLAAGALAMLSLLVWSLAWRWSFPQLLPQSWSLEPWATAQMGWLRALGNTMLLAAATGTLSLTLAIAWLEGEDRGHRSRTRWAEALIYLPLLLPQIGFLYGLNVVFLRAGISGGIGAVIWAQALFVFPYVMIALSDPWRALDRRMLHAAAALGAGPWRRLWAVKLPILLRPILTAAAIGVAVSVAQYLPTLFTGAGRIATLTTEAVTLSSGSDRRITGVYATLQAALPFAAYLAAFAVPALLHRNRRSLTGAAAA
ncbi:ABC transporter permease [Rhodobacter ferrooxidans]|uniref:Binding-protein-dependent transport systems inner membrane component n=1 Tax=Rhodobacter ferrooxidans TaxID=371731 RepID=C8S4B4_9RHOB|nr:ABC transporter permease subunit [Rhodobacter sp. SW2]EEW24173.1 binding-protein-dependent transport systems inner membrane component [Rhodobacter sp. SW2]